MECVNVCHNFALFKLINIMTKQLLFTLLTSALVIGCSDDEFTPQPNESDAEERQIILGDKLPNPYSLSVMQNAADELADDESNLKSAKILQATHRYIRFAPRDTAEVDLVESDTTIFLYSYPMDYEVIQEGDTYTDPDMPEGVLTYLYCAVDVDHKLPNVPYDVLDDLYILEETNVNEVAQDADDEDDITESGNKSVQADYWEALETKANELVGAEVSTNKSKWRPKGDVYYHDTSMNKDIPLEGVPVRCRKSIFVTHQCCTNANGHFSFSSLRGRVTYYIRWSRDHFKIRERSGLKVAETNLKTNTKSSVTYTVKQGTRAWECASIFRAAHFYYYKAKNYGLSSPTKNSLTIRPSIKGKDGENGCYNNHVFGSDIHIYCVKATSAKIFCTTTHEIAHSVHHFWNTIKYYSYNPKMKDTWAGGVAWWLTGKVYESKYYHNHLHYNNQYTGLIEDLVDDYKTGEEYDRVSGFTMKQVEKAFKKYTSWDSLKAYLKTLKVANNEDIDKVFARWN